MYGEGECFLKVSRFENGFTVELMDPGIVKYNQMRDKKNSARKGNELYLDYKSPWKSFVFDDEAKAKTFIAKNIGKAVVAAKKDEGTADEYETAWDTAVAAKD